MIGVESRLPRSVRIAGSAAAFVAVADACAVMWLGYVLWSVEGGGGDALGVAVLKLYGALFFPLGFVIALPALACAILFLRGERWALLAGAVCAPGLLFVGYVMRTTTAAVGSAVAFGSVVAGAMLAGAALGHVGELVANRPLFGKRALRGSGAVWGMIAFFVLSVLWVAQRLPPKPDPKTAKSSSETRERLAETVKVTPRIVETRAPEWSELGPDVIAFTVTPSGTGAATLHQSGRVIQWGTPTDATFHGGFEKATRRIGEWRTTIGARWVRMVGPFVVVGGGTEIQMFSRMGAPTSAEPCTLRGEVVVEAVNQRQLALAANGLCLVNLASGMTGEQISLAGTGCAHITGLDASFDGDELALECERRVVVLDTRTWKAKLNLVTPELVRGSVRLLPERLLGVVENENGHTAVFLSRGNDVPTHASVYLGECSIPPRVFVDAQLRKLLVACNGVCRIEPATGKELDCLVPRTELVHDIALTTTWTKLFPQSGEPMPFRGGPMGFRGHPGEIGWGLALVESRQVKRLTEVRNRF